MFEEGTEVAPPLGTPLELNSANLARGFIKHPEKSFSSLTMNPYQSHYQFQNLIGIPNFGPYSRLSYALNKPTTPVGTGEHDYDFIIKLLTATTPLPFATHHSLWPETSPPLVTSTSSFLYYHLPSPTPTLC